MDKSIPIIALGALYLPLDSRWRHPGYTGSRPQPSYKPTTTSVKQGTSTHFKKETSTFFISSIAFFSFLFYT